MSTDNAYAPRTVHPTIGRLRANLERYIRGKPEVLDLVLVCLIAEGHLLIEDVPGVGKTSIARALAGSIRGNWRRIQFTPDLLPSDITGVTIFNQATRDFEYRNGAVHANIVVADEINRAGPKTQSALLEVMEEGTVTVDGDCHRMPRPFMVIATQNPIELAGTFPLPEAQLDRFLLRISVGYPDHGAEVEVLVNEHAGRNVGDVSPVIDSAEVEHLIALAKGLRVDPVIHDYIVRLTSATRISKDVRLGASPRGSVALLRAARAAALLANRDYVITEDVKVLAVSVLSHRILITRDAELRGETGAKVVADAMRAVPVPTSTSFN